MANLHKIKEIIKEKKLSLREVAKQSGITEQGLQKLIRENSTKVETLEAISRTLGVPVSCFFIETSHDKLEATNVTGELNSVKDELITSLKKQVAMLEDKVAELTHLPALCDFGSARSASTRPAAGASTGITTPSADRAQNPSD